MSKLTDEDMYEMTQGFLAGSIDESKDEIDPETVAKYFHETYERLAPVFSYKTRKSSAVSWEDVPENNKKLMLAVAERVISRFMK